MAQFRLAFGVVTEARSAAELFTAIAERAGPCRPCGADVKIYRGGQWRLFLSWWFDGDFDALDAFVGNAWRKNQWMLPPAEGGSP